MVLISIYATYVLLVKCAFGWNVWDYKTTWSLKGDPDDALNQQNIWESIWNTAEQRYKGISPPPRPRRGHSLHIIDTDPRSDYGGDTYLILFGGRDNDQRQEHIPKTYDVATQADGNIIFTTYDEKPVNPCNDPNHTYYAEDEETRLCNYTTAGIIDVGMVYNDVWAYKLCNSSAAGPGRVQRYFDTACEETGWVLLSAGASEGGCSIQLGIEVCTVPSERYNHASVLFKDGCLYVYGGFSQRCQDYCDDMWSFDIYMKSWRQIYGAGKLTKFYTDVYTDGQFPIDIDLSPDDVPVDNTTKKFAGPSRRWRHSMAISDAYVDPADGLEKQHFALFGGHRLWHGYSPENSQDNDWSSYITRPKGGYMDDLWIYTKLLDYAFPGSQFKKTYGLWKIKQPLEECYRTPGLSWESRFDETCFKVSPPARAGHGSAFDSKRNGVWIYGGYSTYYPYLRTDGIGSGPGVTSVGSGGLIPYPGFQYFKNDLWFYNLTSGYWKQLVFPKEMAIPAPRVDMVFLLLGDVLFIHGGFADNFFFDDTWYYNISSGIWLLKTDFVRPIYPRNCTDDFEYIRQNNCTELLWPLHLKRDDERPFRVLPYAKQDYYWPDTKFGPPGPYFGLQKKGSVNQSLDETAPYGTPMFPYAATGVLQYARLGYTFLFNGSFEASVYERCTSAFAEPTRGHLIDGLAGRSNSSVFIATPRPQKPGWDGCRDRSDGRVDLPSKLQFVQPLARHSHRAIFYPNTSEIIFYGGFAYTQEQSKSLDNTYPSTVLADMWYYNLFHCINNCSFNGDCFYGFCNCYVGYYGADCSNVSCPGTFCYYDELNQQQCTHACQAGYEHKDDDVYVQDIAKLPCSLDHQGESNGICNGFGKTMCAPPFLGDDCGTKDCKDNCSFNGWCAIEYPVSRCMCIPGYYGETCSEILCLNNCSYPNGICNTTTGQCQCNMMYSPYNNTREFKPWDGEDCSYIFPYAAATRVRLFAGSDLLGAGGRLWIMLLLAGLLLF